MMYGSSVFSSVFATTERVHGSMMCICLCLLDFCIGSMFVNFHDVG